MCLVYFLLTGFVCCLSIEEGKLREALHRTLILSQLQQRDIFKVEICIEEEHAKMIT